METVNVARERMQQRFLIVGVTFWYSLRLNTGYPHQAPEIRLYSVGFNVLWTVPTIMKLHRTVGDN